MEKEEVKSVLREAFGDSSSDSDAELCLDQSVAELEINDSSIFGDSHVWEPVNEINGLWICKDFLSPGQHSTLLSALEKEGYFSDSSHNQAMKFGDLPPWAIELSHDIRENVLLSGYFTESVDVKRSDNRELFPPELLWREPFFNQLIVNIYQPGEGICAHVDLMRFEDGIAIVSLESSCVMHFSRVEAEVNDLEPTQEAKIPVLLTPGSVILMWGEARYMWKHEINRKPGFQSWEGQEIEQGRRTSVTLRRLCQTD